MASLLLDDAPTLLTADPLVLDCGARTLTGPSGTVRVNCGPFPILRALMRRPGCVVSLDSLVAACWFDADLEPDGGPKAVRARVARARETIAAVGASPSMLASRFQQGYVIEGPPRVVRLLTPAQAAAVDALARTHPAFAPAEAA